MGEVEQEPQRPRRPSLGERVASFVLRSTPEEFNNKNNNTETPPTSPVKRRPSLGRLIRRPSLGNSPEKARRRSSVTSNNNNNNNGGSGAFSPQKRRPSLGKSVTKIMNSLGVGSSRHQSTSKTPSSDDETADGNASFNDLEDPGSTDSMGTSASSQRANSSLSASSSSLSPSQSVLQSIGDHEQRLTMCLDKIQEQIESNLAMATARIENGGEDSFAAHSGAILSMRKAHKNRIVHASTATARTKLQGLRRAIQTGKAGTKAEQKAALRDIFATLKQESAEAVVPVDEALMEELRQMKATEK
uniref:Uncharacterized protein n=1 Tax=Amphora coffeiformis TaxID=265554 RepID=A0A7S3L171_9STRA|mmetsp:Transcript_584/g.1125  ORF Transcript_584/g.1125 Transcript_584/m.1125 type:complete len:303 (+) Transcript_584:226-1134(+)|eukprot:scaffold1221_cov207-Amphora_coffeaeformis.AAC.8